MSKQDLSLTVGLPPNIQKLVDVLGAAGITVRRAEPSEFTSPTGTDQDKFDLPAWATQQQTTPAPVQSGPIEGYPARFPAILGIEDAKQTHDVAEFVGGEYIAAPISPFGKTYIVPMEFAKQVEAETGTGIEYGSSILFVPTTGHVTSMVDMLPVSALSFDNVLLHAGIPHLVMDPEVGSEVTFAWEVK